MISCTGNRLNELLTEYLHKILKLHENETFYGPDFAVVAFNVGTTNGTKKFFNGLTNCMDELDHDTIKIWSKKEDKHIYIETKRFIMTTIMVMDSLTVSKLELFQLEIMKREEDLLGQRCGTYCTPLFIIHMFCIVYLMTQKRVTLYRIICMKSFCKFLSQN